jgi:tetratricopeptide (TPR) repeat protein
MNDKIVEGDQLLVDGMAYEALQKYLDALVAGETTAYLYKKIGHCNKILGDNENAIDYYEKSLELDDQDFEVLYNCGEAYQLNNQLDEAIELYDSVIDLAAGTGGDIIDLAEQKKKEAQSVLLNRQGGNLMKEQNYDEAKQCFLEAIELNPLDRRNYLNIGVIYLKQGDTDQAIEWMNKTIEIDPRYIRCYYNLGTIYYKTGRYKNAIDIFEKALQISPDDADSEDIQTNLSLAQTEFETTWNELLQILEGQQVQISTDDIAVKATAVIGVEINSVDIAIQSDGKYQVIAYSSENNFKISFKDGELIINKL